MLLRLADLQDLDALVDLQRVGAVRALGHLFPQEQYPFPSDEIYARCVKQITDPYIDVYVVEHAGQVSGFAATRGNELLHFGTAVETWGAGLAVTRTTRS